MNEAPSTSSNRSEARLCEVAERGQVRKILKVLFGCNDQDLEELFSISFQVLTGGGVEILVTAQLSDFIDRACFGDCDLGIFIPQNLRQTGSDPWDNAVGAIQQIKRRSQMKIVVVGVHQELTEHGQVCRDAGADAVLDMSLGCDALVDMARRLLAQA